MSPRNKHTRSTLWVAAVIGLAAGTPSATAEVPGPSPFVAKFAIEWKGLTAGYSTLELARAGPDGYTYRSRNLARGIFRLAFPDAISQSSTFSIVDGVVRPSHYEADDGKPDSDQAITLQFDWRKGRVTGTAARKPVDVALEPGTQDAMSVQIALMSELAAGHLPKSFWLMDNDEIKEYQYVREGTESLDTPIGKLATVIYRSERAGSDRVTRLWLAPDLGYLPVRAERRRKDKVDFALTIRALKKD